MKLILFVLFSVLLFSGCTVNDFSTTVPNKQVEQTFRDRQLVVITINGKELNVEVVKSPASITKGLGERDSIGSDGMLFVLPERRVANFWMHGMRFPLDFIWIDGNSIVGVTQDVPAPANPASTTLPSYSSGVPVTHVLELDAGKAAELSITEGQQISISH